MKSLYLLVMLLLVLHGAFAQNAPKAMSIEDKEFNNYFLNNDIPTVKGKIINLAAGEINSIKIVYHIVTPFHELQVSKSCTLNADGSFELKLDYPFPYQQIFIDVDSLFYTGVYATSDLFIELDAALIKTHPDLSFNGPGVKYLGNDGALNTLINNHRLFKDEKQGAISGQLANLSSLREKDFDGYIKTFDSLYLIYNNLDNTFIKDNPSDFSWLIKNERMSDYLGGLCVSYWGKQMPAQLFEKVKAHRPFAVSNEGMLFVRYLFTYLNSAVQSKRTVEKLPYDLAEVTLQTIGLLDSLFTQSKSDLFKFQFSSRDPAANKKMIETVLPHVKTEWCKKAINDEFNKSIAKLADIANILNESKLLVSGNPFGQPISELPFGARLYKVDAMKADSLLAAIKNSFKNKAILIDCWATWCVPCLSEFPHSKILSDECKDLPIEFVYLCTSRSSDMEQWKRRIAEFKLSGTHIFVEESIESALMNLFSVSGFPSYLFINKDGAYKPGLINRPSELDKEKLAALLQ